MQLDKVLNDLGAIVDDLRDASKQSDDVRKRLVVAGRQRLAERMRDLVVAADSDPRIASNSQLSLEFQKRTTEWRHAMAQFQAQWRVAETNIETGEYAQSVASLRVSNTEFLRWARAVLTATN